MFNNLPLVSLNMSDIFGIDGVTVISSVLHMNFAKIHTDSEVVLSIILLFYRMLSLVAKIHMDSEVVLSITLLFCRMLSLVKIFH